MGKIVDPWTSVEKVYVPFFWMQQMIGLHFCLSDCFQKYNVNGEV